MHANLLLAFAQAALVTVTPGADDQCPSAAQVQAALQTHAPRLVAPRPESDPDKQLALNLAKNSPSGEISFSLLDSRGRVRLYRSLPPPPGDKAHDCAALADTVALIIDRFFNEVELPSLPEKKPPPPPPLPPPPPPLPPPLPPPPPRTPELPLSPPELEEQPASQTKPPRFALSAIVGRRVPGGAVDLGGYEFKLALGAALTSAERRNGQLWVELASGIVGIANKSWEYNAGAGSATAVRAGADLALLMGWPAWRGRFHVGPLLSLELIWLEWRDADSNGRIQQETRVGSGAGVRAGYQYTFRRRFFARTDVSGCLAIVRHEVITQSNTNAALFVSPPAYFTFSLGVGLWL